MNQSFGVIGLGAIGGGMAASLCRAGELVSGYDIDPVASAAAVEHGVEVMESAGAVFAACDVAIISLPSVAAVEQTYAQLSDAEARSDGVVIECSTLDPDLVRQCARQARQAGRRFVEASVIGLREEALQGQLYFLLGGGEADCAAAGRFLRCCGRGGIHLGAVGAGSIAKVLNNAIGMATMLAFAEAIAVAESSGVDAQNFLRAVREGQGAGASVVFDRHAEWAVDGARQPPTPIHAKDGAALAAFAGDRLEALPMLAQMVESVAQLSRTGDVGMVTAAACRARDRMARRGP